MNDSSEAVKRGDLPPLRSELLRVIFLIPSLDRTQLIAFKPIRCKRSISHNQHTTRTLSHLAQLERFALSLVSRLALLLSDSFVVVLVLVVSIFFVLLDLPLFFFRSLKSVFIYSNLRVPVDSKEDTQRRFRPKFPKRKGLLG